MRKIIMAAVAAATLGTLSVTAEAMPAVGTTAVSPAIQANSAIQKTEVVVVKRRPIVRRPAVVVVHRRRPVVVVKKIIR